MGTTARLPGLDPELFDVTGSRIEKSHLIGPLVPVELGGAGLSAVETSAALEGLGAGTRDPGLALAVVVHAALTAAPIRAFGTAGQRERYLPRMASGEWIGAVSLHQTQGAALGTPVTARRVPDGWVLDGTLELVAGGPAAHHFLVVAAHPEGGRTAFVVDRDTPGLRVEESGPGALRGCGWARLRLGSCPVPDDAVLGTPGGARTEAEPLLMALDGVFTSAPWVGLARELLREASEGAGRRELFGRPLRSSQSVRFTLADMATRVELARGMVLRAAADLDAGGARSAASAAAAKLFVVDSVSGIVAGALRLSPAWSDTEPGLAQRIQHDAAFFSTAAGTTEILRSVVAASALELG